MSPSSSNNFNTITNSNTNTIANTNTTTPTLLTSPSSSSSSPSSTTTTQACAACKYQRRKCQPDCTLAPYFPANQPRMFLNAHRLFGVSNILKTLRSIDPSHRHEAMSSIIFHSNARAQDPVLGCCRLILDLQRQIAHCTAELDLVFRQLAVFRQQQQQQQTQPILPFPTEEQIDGIDINPSQLLVDNGNNANELGSSTTNINEANDGVYFGQEDNGREIPTSVDHQQQYFYYYEGGGGGSGNDNNEDNHESLCLVVDQRQKVAAIDSLDSDCDVKPFELLHQRREVFLAAAAAGAAEVEVDDGGETQASSAFHCDSGPIMTEHEVQPNSIQHELKNAASLLTLTNCKASIV